MTMNFRPLVRTERYVALARRPSDNIDRVQQSIVRGHKERLATPGYCEELHIRREVSRANTMSKRKGSITLPKFDFLQDGESDNG